MLRVKTKVKARSVGERPPKLSQFLAVTDAGTC
jgi:hypothetical protein